MENDKNQVKKSNRSVVRELDRSVIVFSMDGIFMDGSELARIYYETAEKYHMEAAGHFQRGDAEAAFESMVRAHKHKALGNKMQERKPSNS